MSVVPLYRVSAGVTPPDGRYYAAGQMVFDRQRDGHPTTHVIAIAIDVAHASFIATALNHLGDTLAGGGR